MNVVSEHQVKKGVFSGSIGHTRSTGATDHETELDTLLDILLPADLDLHETGKKSVSRELS
jgi:hypothetical protein